MVMEDIVQLRCRNAELETELRIIKDQLAHAHGATSHLATSFSTQLHTLWQTEFTSLQTRLDGALAENARLRSYWATAHRNGLPRDERPTITPRDQGQSRDASIWWGPRHLHGEPSPPFSHQKRTDNGGGESLNLIDFDEGDRLPSAPPWPSDRHVFATPTSTPFMPSSLNHRTDDSFASWLRPNAADVNSSDLDKDARSIASMSYAGVMTAGQNGEQGHFVTHGDRSKSFITNPPPLSEYDTPIQIPARKPFADHEYNRLIGTAVFIEDMSARQKMDHWRGLATQFRGHSALEWQTYYEQTVRPKYLEKVAGKAAEIEPADEWETEDEETLSGGLPATSRDADLILIDDIAALRWAPKRSEKKVVPNNLQHTFENSQLDEIQEKVPGVENDCADTSCKAADVRGDRNVGTKSHEDLEKKSPVSAPILSGLDEALVADDMASHQVKVSDFSTESVRDGPTYFDHDCKPQLADRDPYFTVVLSGLPSNINLADALEKVRGGKIVEAMFLPTAGMKTNPRLGTNAIMIRFLSMAVAEAFVNLCDSGAVLFVATDNQLRCTAHASLLPTACRPLHPNFVRDIHCRGLSRVIFVDDRTAGYRWTPEQVIGAVLSFDNQRHRICKTPIRTSRHAESGVLVLEFASIFDAMNAEGVIAEHFTFFQDMSTGFLPDPCTQLFHPTAAKTGKTALKHSQETITSGIKKDERDPSEEQLEHAIVEAEKSDTVEG